MSAIPHVYSGAVLDARPVSKQRMAAIDPWFVGAVLMLLALGIVMVSSASITLADRQMGQPFYFLYRQLFFVVLGLLAAMGLAAVPLRVWEKTGPLCLAVGVVLLVLVLIPGLGHVVNGSRRWLGVGGINFQPSELMKLCFFIYLAGFLQHHAADVRASVRGAVQPLVALGLAALLLMVEPDFGSTAVLAAAVLGVLFLAGVRLWPFAVLAGAALLGLAVLALTSSYRLDRLTSFMNPWADQYNSGYQLTQALIAFGRGGWLGVGLGASVQKLNYLPEAHTDFVFAVMAEELGLLGSLLVIALFAVVIARAFIIARRAQHAGRMFAAYLAFGLGLWIGLQALINIGVNMGVLPTKGLTLPLMSYGGSSMVVMCVACGLLLRVDYENRRVNS